MGFAVFAFEAFAVFFREKESECSGDDAVPEFFAGSEDVLIVKVSGEVIVEVGEGFSLSPAVCDGGVVACEFCCFALDEVSEVAGVVVFALHRVGVG